MVFRVFVPHCVFLLQAEAHRRLVSSDGSDFEARFNSWNLGVKLEDFSNISPLYPPIPLKFSFHHVFSYMSDHFMWTEPKKWVMETFADRFSIDDNGNTICLMVWNNANSSLHFNMQYFIKKPVKKGAVSCHAHLNEVVGILCSAHMLITGSSPKSALYWSAYHYRCTVENGH